MNHSYSSLTLYEKCPWLFYQKNILHTPEKNEENINMAIGLAVHKSIESQLNGVQKIVADAQALKESFQNPPNSSLIYMQGLSVIPESFILDSSGFQVKTEKRMFFHLPTPRVSEPFTTKFDAYWVNGNRLNIVDWKTGAHVDKDAEKQLQFYALGGIISTRTGKNPIEEVSCTLYYLKLHEAKTLEYIWGCEDVENIMEWAISTAESVESCIGSQSKSDPEQTYERNRESTECNWCPYRTECFVSL